ncbi:MAG: peptidoglycan DD-metalloendopeptidase family protein [Candidatus Onthoplasma sp.]
MQNENSKQKRKILMNYLCATIIGMLVIACAIVIAVANANNVSGNTGNITETIPVANTTFVVPMKNATLAKDYSGSELQYNDTLKQWEIHKGIDFVAGDNLDVFAVADGTVSNVYTNYLEGNVVEITHANGIISIYKSLEAVNVKVGEKVNAGTIIGQAGDSMAQELNTGKHLHLEMKKDGKLVDPNDYIDLGSK